MEWLKSLLLVIDVLSAISVVLLVLLQQGKGADMGASFGAGASGSLFGASGSSNFLSRSTGIAAAVFFVASLGLSVLSVRGGATGSVMDGTSVKVVPAASKSVPALPAQKQQIPN